jgi:aromatic ring-opening dioxygenase catalytic subunit (LigB family)
MQPVIYLPHGGGPWPFVKFPLGSPAEDAALRAYLEKLPATLPAKPKAILAVSAHWEEKVPTVMTAERPPMFYDYYGFPPESYTITWPAPGDPKLAARVRELLGKAGFASAADEKRGFDHGTFVPLKLSWPNAEIPTTQLSLIAGLDPADHFALGRALAPLRSEGVLIVGSGMSYHNMRGFRDPNAAAASREFDAWLTESATAEPETRRKRLESWTSAPRAREVHPREEHLIPLMVVAGAAGDDRGRVGYSGDYARVRISAIHYGT